MAKSHAHGRLYFSSLTEDEAEAEIEWILEAKAEGYTWKQLAKKYNVSIPTLKKFVGFSPVSKKK